MSIVTVCEDRVVEVTSADASYVSFDKGRRPVPKLSGCGVLK